jgi:hypothetical protein
MSNINNSFLFTILLFYIVSPLRAFYIDAELGNEINEVQMAWIFAGANGINGGVEKITDQIDTLMINAALDSTATVDENQSTFSIQMLNLPTANLTTLRIVNIKSGTCRG